MEKFNNTVTDLGQKVVFVDCLMGFQRFEELDFPCWCDDDDCLARTNREPERTAGFVVVLIKQIFRRINPPIADFAFQVELEEIQ